MNRILYPTLFVFIIMTLLISACSDKNIKNNLVVGNKSSETISNIVIQRVGKSDVMGSNLKHNQHSYFDMGLQKKCTYKVEFEDKNNQSTCSNEFTSDFNKDEIVNISVLKDNSGKWSIIIEN